MSRGDLTPAMVSLDEIKIGLTQARARSAADGEEKIWFSAAEIGRFERHVERARAVLQMGEPDDDLPVKDGT